LKKLGPDFESTKMKPHFAGDRSEDLKGEELCATDEKTPSLKK
jgi:hypothetical protein